MDEKIKVKIFAKETGQGAANTKKWNSIADEGSLLTGSTAKCLEGDNYLVKNIIGSGKKYIFR